MRRSDATLSPLYQPDVVDVAGSPAIKVIIDGHDHRRSAPAITSRPRTGPTAAGRRPAARSHAGALSCRTGVGSAPSASHPVAADSHLTHRLPTRTETRQPGKGCCRAAGDIAESANLLCAAREVDSPPLRAAVEASAVTAGCGALPRESLMHNHYPTETCCTRDRSRRASASRSTNLPHHVATTTVVPGEDDVPLGQWRGILKSAPGASNLLGIATLKTEQKFRESAQRSATRAGDRRAIIDRRCRNRVINHRCLRDERR